MTGKYCEPLAFTRASQQLTKNHRWFSRILAPCFFIIFLLVNPSLAQEGNIENPATIENGIEGIGLFSDQAFPSIPILTREAGEGSAEEYSVTIQILVLMTALTFLPSLLLMMTSFTRIIIVFSILRQAIGLQQTPSNQILIGLSLFLTLFIMTPVFTQINAQAIDLIHRC